MEWTDEHVRRFWDYETQFPENYFTHQVGKELVAYVSPYLVQNMEVLDFGCGLGFLIPHLLERKVYVTGADFSSESVSRVKETYRGTKRFRGAFMTETLLGKQFSFDVIFVTEVIEHLNDMQLSGTFDVLRSLLKTQGIVIITTPNEEELSRSLIYCPEADCVFHRWNHLQSFSTVSLRSLLIKDGFEIVTLAAVNLRELFRRTSFIERLKKTLRQVLGRGSHEKPPHLIAIAKKEDIR